MIKGRRCAHCGGLNAIPGPLLIRFKWYRRWIGGRWAFLDGQWRQAKENGYLIYPGVGVHYLFCGIEAREDYRKNKNECLDFD